MGSKLRICLNCAISANIDLSNMRVVANKHRLTAYHKKLSTNIEDFKRRRKLKISGLVNF